MRSYPEMPSRGGPGRDWSRHFPVLTALLVVLLTVSNARLLLDSATFRPSLKS